MRWTLEEEEMNLWEKAEDTDLRVWSMKSTRQNFEKSKMINFRRQSKLMNFKTKTTTFE